MPTADDLKVTPVSYVMLKDQSSGSAYVSTQPSDDNGDWTVFQVPPGTYTGFSGPSPSGPWNAEPRLANFVVANSQDAAGDLTPPGAVFPGSGTGAQSVAGILAGNGVPSNGVGQDGWFYFRADGGVGTNVYKKTTGAWAAIL